MEEEVGRKEMDEGEEKRFKIRKGRRRRKERRRGREKEEGGGRG